MRSLFNCKGQSIVEITLVTPIILIALYVPFDFGMAIFTGHLAQNAVRDGARRAASTDVMTNAKAVALATAVYNDLPPNLISGSTTKQVTVNYYTDANCAENVEVIAQGTYSLFWYRMMRLIGMNPPPLAITRTTKMWYDHQPDRNGISGSTTTFCGTVAATGTYP